MKDNETLRSVIVASIFFAASGAAHAYDCVSLFGSAMAADTNGAFYDGNQLLRLPRSALIGYVAGVADSGRFDRCHCLPGVEAGQIADVVKNSLTDHPETRQLSANHLVTQALMKAFPCSRQ